ncbi:MAG: cytochrome B [Tabrizicola sp.]|nr:cytochrome B [Tabrizicola sp.]
MASRARTGPPDLWDPVVRITHWGLAVIVILNALITDGGSTLHVWLGWIGMALLLLRLVWGLLGPVEARFSAFPPGLRQAVSHLRALATGRRVGHYPSHNPAGALMIYAFWASLAVVTCTGLVLTGGATPMQVAADKAAVASGDWSALAREEADGGEDGGAFRKQVEEVHELVADLILILAVLHVAGVAVESRAMRRNLVAPMLAGLRRSRGK